MTAAQNWHLTAEPSDAQLAMHADAILAPQLC